MSSPDREYVRQIEAENSRLRDTVQSLDIWIEHWQMDVKSNLKPLPTSLEHARGLCRSALSKEIAR